MDASHDPPSAPPKLNDAAGGAPAAPRGDTASAGSKRHALDAHGDGGEVSCCEDDPADPGGPDGAQPIPNWEGLRLGMAESSSLRHAAGSVSHGPLVDGWEFCGDRAATSRSSEYPDGPMPSAPVASLIDWYRQWSSNPDMQVSPQVEGTNGLFCSGKTLRRASRPKTVVVEEGVIREFEPPGRDMTVLWTKVHVQKELSIDQTRGLMALT